MDKKPTQSRFLLVALTVSLACPLPGNPAGATDRTGAPLRPLTEAETVRLALERPAVRALAEGRIALARSDVVAAGLWANPQFEYAREEINRQSTDSIEESYWLSQRFELSGRRGLRKEAAEHRVQAATLDAEAERFEIEADIKRRFYRILHQQEKLSAIENWTSRLDDIGTVIRKRKSAGEVSGYDTLRLSREQSSVRATLQKEQGRYRRLWSELSTVLGGPGVVGDYDGVAGRLLPDSPPSLDELLATITRRPDIARLEQEATAHELQRRAGERAWVPELTLGVGHKTLDDELGTDSGPMVAAGISIPLFDHGQAEQQRALASRTIARSQHELALAIAEGEVRGLWREIDTLTGETWQRHRDVKEHAARLIAIAEVAYRGGELGVLELLDAYRGAYDAELEALETAARARQARVELDRLTGGQTQ